MQWEIKNQPELDYIRKMSTWRKWFAWYPVITETVEGLPGKMVWLETVYRRHEWISNWDQGWWRTVNLTQEQYDRILK